MNQLLFRTEQVRATLAPDGTCAWREGNGPEQQVPVDQFFEGLAVRRNVGRTSSLTVMIGPAQLGIADEASISGRITDLPKILLALLNGAGQATAGQTAHAQTARSS